MKDAIIVEATQEQLVCAEINTISVLLERKRLGMRPSIACTTIPVSLDKPQIYVKAILTAGTVETYAFDGAYVPTYFSKCITAALQSGIWQGVELLNNARSLAAYSKPQASIVVRQKRNTEHAKAYITLYEEQTVTCEETGISYACRLAVPQSLNLETLHPLAFIVNIEKLLRAYSKSGIRLEQELESQVLAGMLLTTLRHRGLLICKDAIKANLFLQHAHKESLSHAIRFFFYSSSTVGMPALAMHLADSAVIHAMLSQTDMSDLEKRQQQAEHLIYSHIKACKGESTRDEPAHILQKPETKRGKVKVYTDPVKAQVKEILGKEVQAALLLGKLKSEHGALGNHSLLFGQIKNYINMLHFMSEKARKDIAAKIMSTFPTDEDAHGLSEIFNATKTDAIEDDLFSFTQQLEQEVEQHKAKAANEKQTKRKFDFLSKLTKKGPDNV